MRPSLPPSEVQSNGAPDAALAAGAQLLRNLFPNGLDLQNLAATRSLLATMHAKRPTMSPAKFGVQIETYRVEELTLRCYRPVKDQAQVQGLPVLLWFHGGGFVLGDVAWEDKRCMQLARDIGCVVVAPAYRLAPEHPYPAALHDGAAALRFLRQQAAELAIDADRLAVGGASAGAGLAAALVLWLRDQQQPLPCCQVLLYPMLDDRTVESSNKSSDPLHADQFHALGWSLAENTLAWRYYLSNMSHVPPYAAPARANDLQQLPPALLCVGSVDLFRRECHDYAERLQRSGVATEIYCYAQAFHGFDSWAPQSAAAKDCWQRQVDALTRAFARSVSPP